uniref:tRNA (uracil(54)-C(5))-methyltransferase n=1 Tax=Saccoglossus kowalevskii TaxID=10224 RepID=A0ABM0MGB4_SACKO|nr:PREDICTED: tRNA (uracil-5-)-methyltransferase homolog A-like [Saccoglossus kowalevskii]
MKTAAKAVQSYIQQSARLGYNNRNHDGFWKLVTMRTSLRNQTMVLVTVNTEGLSEEEIEKEKKSLLAYYEDGAGKDDKPSSLLIQAQENKIGVSGVYDIDSPSEALFGDPYITEDILGIKFRISAEAFFQVNSIAAGILYTAIKEISGVSENTTVLDICCGTGTIGISLAKNVKRVIGVEMCKQAVKDAEHNAKENGITNIKFLCGKAEDVLHKAIYDVYGSKEVVGILDPPRAGLHAKVIRAIRGCQYINKLVYVSCSPRSAESNFVDLCRQTSKRIKGEAFRPTCAIPVDLFPHTKHCELIVLFERDSVTISHNDSKPNEETIVPEQNTSHDSGEHDIDGVSKTEHDSDKIPDKQCTSDIVMNTEESTSHGSGEPLDTQGTSNIDGVSHSEQSTSHGSGEPLDTQGTSNIDEVSHSEQSSNSGEPLNKQSTSDIDEKAPCTKSMCIEPSDGLASTISQHSCIESGGSVEKDVETEMPSANVETKEAAVCSDNGVSKMDLDKQNV